MREYDNAGVVIVAKESNTVDYLKIAEWNAKRAMHHLKLPAAIITDSDRAVDPSIITIRVPKTAATSIRKFPDHDSTTQWNNTKRWEVYDLSPFDRTVLIDADYIINSSNLRLFITSPRDFIVCKNAVDVTGLSDFDDQNNFGHLKMPMYWATLIVFSKSETARLIFEVMKTIEDNYEHYATLYKFHPKPFRNDYALSIAIHLVNGMRPFVDPNSPFSLLTVLPEHSVSNFGPSFNVHFDDPQSKTPRFVVLYGSDLHIMNKANLEELIDAGSPD